VAKDLGAALAVPTWGVQLSIAMPRLPGTDLFGRWFVPGLFAGLLALVMAWAPLTSMVNLVRMPLHSMGMPVGDGMAMPWAVQRAQGPIVQSLASFPRLQRQGIAIKVGVHAESIYELSLAQKTYFVDGRFWLEWPNSVQEWMQREDLDPLAVVDFVNQVEDWNSEVRADFSEPEQRPDGTWYQSFRFSSHFDMGTIDFRKYPFGSLQLPIVLQVVPAHSEIDGRPLLLVPERNQRGIIGEDASLDGYSLTSATLAPVVRTYRTDYGLRRLVRISQVKCIFNYQSSFWPGFVKYVLPLAIILLVVLISPYLESSLGDVRLAIPTTALLTLVFLQQGYSAGLPQTPYLSYLDKLYAVAYLICIGMFMLFAWSSNRYALAGDDQKAAVQARLDRIDQRFQLVSLGLIVVVAFEVWLT
jgi:hypothetical protein